RPQRRRARPTATHRRQATARPPRRVSGRRSRSRPVPRAPAGRSTEAPLVVDAEPRPRNRPQPLLGDRLAAHQAAAVRTVVDPAEGGLDLTQRLLDALLEAVVQLALVGLARRVTKVVVVPAEPDLAELVLEAARVLVVEEVHGLDEPRALGLEQL